jgi:hypothetical protein
LSTKTTLIACLGPKRAGSTLQFNLARNLLQANGVAFSNLGYCSAKKYSVDSLLSKHNNTTAILKSHDFELNLPKNALILCTKRDIRDIYASMKLKWNVGISDLPNVYMNYHRHLNSIKKRENVLIQEYHDLFYEPQKSCDEISNFLSLASCSISNFESVISFDKKFFGILFLIARKIARFLSFNDILDNSFYQKFRVRIYDYLLRKSIDNKNQLHPDHISKNKGNPGAWKSELTIEEKKLFTELESKFKI